MRVEPQALASSVVSPAFGSFRGDQRQMLNVYVDETGDRGFHRAASRFFAMTALMVPAEDDHDVRFTAAGLRGMINTEKPLHWVDHFKAKWPARRRVAAEKLALMPTAKVAHVVTPKDAVAPDAGVRDGVLFYNFTARLLLERVAHAAKHWPGGSRHAIVRLGSVRGMDHGDTLAYLGRVRQGIYGFREVPWGNIHWPPTWHTTEYDGIQLADIHAGLLNVALTGKPMDAQCAENLLLCKEQLYRSPGGLLLGWGVKVYTMPSFVTGRCWWPDWKAQ